MKLAYILDHLPGALQQLQYSIHSAGRTDHAAQRTEHILTGFGRQAMRVELPPRARQRGTPPGCSPGALMQSAGPKESYGTAGRAGVDGFTDPRKASANLEAYWG